MKIKLNNKTRLLALPQILEVDDAEASRLIMLGVAEILKADKSEKDDEPKEVKKEMKKATRK